MLTNIKIGVTLFFILLITNIKSQESLDNQSIIVKFKSSIDKNKEFENEKILNNLKITNEFTGLDRIIINNSNRVYKLTGISKLNSKSLLNKLKENINVEYVEMDILGSSQGEPIVEPTDSEYYKQWAFKNNGNIPFTKSKIGSDIEMEKAWEIEQGDSNVVVAILDSGIKLNHDEFKNRIWRNYTEIPNNGIDDDNNGFIDDTQGWNFADVSNDVNDDSGHGTNIASIIGANGNNGIGFSGMDWNCKLMILKVLKNDVGYYSWWASSIYYAVDNGADVINMSLGGDVESQLLNEAIQYALNHNVVVVVSMGNNNTDNISYPSNYPGVIAVGSTNPDDSRTTSFSWSSTNGSNYGKHISVVAPGNYIYGLNYANGNYDTYYSGTSQSAAFVSALASLLIGQTPSITNVEVKTLIENTAEDNISHEVEDFIGWDTYYGNGRINAFKALSINSKSIFTITEDDLLVYPNPTNSFITINFPVKTESILVFDSFGVKIFESLNNLQTEKIITFNEKGVFFIQLVAMGQKVSKKIVVI